MKRRILWPVVAVLVVLVALAFLASPGSAQRDPGPFGVLGPRVGRFTVAHASADAVLVLDTATGKVYKAGKDDFKKMSELPKIEEAPRRPFGDKERERPFGGRDREKKDGDRPGRGADKKEADPPPVRRTEKKEAEAERDAADRDARRAAEERRRRQAEEEARRNRDEKRPNN